MIITVIIFFRVYVWLLLIAAIIAFLATSITCAILEQEKQQDSENAPYEVLVLRVVINGLLFIVMSIALSMCVYRISKTSAANMVLEAKVGIQLVLSCISSTWPNGNQFSSDH